MSYVIAKPEVIASAATDLAGIGSNLSAAHVAAAAATLAVLPAAADEVSVTIANFSRHAQRYQAQAGQAAAAQEQFVQRLGAGAGSYAAAEAANVASLTPAAVTAAPIASGISALWGDVQAFLDGAVTTLEQMLNQLAGFLLPLIRQAIAFSVAFFFVFVLPTIDIALNILVAL
jgi:PE family